MRTALFYIAAFFVGMTAWQSVSDARAPLTEKRDCVILLHGMGRTKYSMKKLEKHLKKEGLHTVNDGYPSTRESIETLSKTHLPEAIKQCRKTRSGRIHFVTHSLGGILVRQYLQKNTLPGGSRLVMISPPNQGSEVADFLKDFFLYEWATGPAGQQLGTDTNSVPNRLKPIDIDVGIITGNKSLNPFFSSLLPGKDDGKVSVERAKLKGMKDFLIVPRSHTFIMTDSEVLRQTTCFLINGRFDHERYFTIENAERKK